MNKSDYPNYLLNAIRSTLILMFLFLAFGCGQKEVFIETPLFELYDKGTEEIVNYAKYGEFEGIGSPEYSYKVTDLAALTRVAGEGIYPNGSSLQKGPEFKRLNKEGKLRGSHWDFINTRDYQANFYKWASASEERGVKLFYTALALERSGHIKHAIKAYYALVVHFPKTVGWTYWHTPWYVGQVAIDRINFLCKKYPDLKWKLIDACILVKGGYDDDVRNDLFVVNPGKLVEVDSSDKVLSKQRGLEGLKIVKSVGEEYIKLLQYENNDWQLRVNGEPYIIKAIAYQPTKIGQSPDDGSLQDWMQTDNNNNGKVDGPYDAWVDNNRNQLQDADEPVVGDFHLLWDMGVNTIRIYHHSTNKELLRDLYKNYGIMVLMGDFLGAYAIGSGTTWYKGTDYSDEEQQNNMLQSLKEMVEEYKHEPYILTWVLGNENNYGVANNSKQNPSAYYSFVNKAAEYIKSIDPYERPVAICNGEVKFLDIFAKECPAVDIFGLNTYRGEYGFGHLWKSVKEEVGKPVLITEYGCPAYNKYTTEEEAEIEQAEFLKANWIDIISNSGGYGAGNSLGGVLFEWIDEWWKAYEPSLHDTKPLWAGSFPDGWMHEEWLGVASQGNGEGSPYKRILRKSYYTLKELWRK
ncbi:MAG: glycoside hydrolase family 2 TIM barrel-domain containing protein [Candidatus Omnitrophota bacterium]